MPSADYAWGGHRNGHIPSSALVSVNGKLMERNTAAAFSAMARAAEADGVSLRIADAYRPYSTQAAARRSWEANGTNLAGNPVPAVARPGSSVHGWGKALDIFGNGSHAWLARNAHRFGFRGISSEPWHWQYTGSHAETPSRQPGLSQGDLSSILDRVGGDEAAGQPGSLVPSSPQTTSPQAVVDALSPFPLGELDYSELGVDISDILDLLDDQGYRNLLLSSFDAASHLIAGGNRLPLERVADLGGEGGQPEGENDSQSLAQRVLSKLPSAARSA